MDDIKLFVLTSLSILFLGPWLLGLSLIQRVISIHYVPISNYILMTIDRWSFVGTTIARGDKRIDFKGTSKDTTCYEESQVAMSFHFVSLRRVR